MSHPVDVGVQRSALNLLRTLAVDSSDGAAVVFSLCGRIADTMTTLPHDGVVQRRGLGLVWALTSDNATRAALSTFATAAISALKGHPNDDRVVEEALGALSSLAVLPANRVTLMTHCGVLQGVLAAHGGSPGIQRMGMALLANLAFDGHNRGGILEWAAPQLADALTAHCDDASVQMFALTTVWNLALLRDDDSGSGSSSSTSGSSTTSGSSSGASGAAAGTVTSPKEFTKTRLPRSAQLAPVLHAVVTVLTTQLAKPAIVEQALSVLGALCANADNRRLLLTSSGAVSAIRSALDAHGDNAAIQERALGALQALLAPDASSGGSGAAVPSATIVDVIGVVQRAMKAHVDSALLQVRGLGLLGTALSVPQAVGRLPLSPLVDDVVAAMAAHESDVSVAGNGLALLCGIAGNCDAGTTAALRAVVQRVVAVMEAHAGSGQVQQNGVATLCCLVRQPARGDDSGSSGSDDSGRESADSVSRYAAEWTRGRVCCMYAMCVAVRRSAWV